MKRAVIRQLRPGEEVPPGQPKRYRTSHGYMRLRWLVGPQQYLETYEHRVRDGVVVRAEHVHHINGKRDDNRPENLREMSAEEHNEHHTSGKRGAGTFYPFRSRGAMEKAAYAEQNRRLREERRQFMVELYKQGRTTPEIADEVGLHHSGVSRHLRSAGAVMRTPRATGPTVDTRKLVHARSGMECERCGRSLMWEPSEIHHRLPRGMGGSSNPVINLTSNLVHLCRPCHSWAESNRDDARRDGLLVPFGWNPADVAVRIRGENRLLNNEGGYDTVPPEA